MSKGKNPEPNYDILLKSTISSLQEAYKKYILAVRESLSTSFFNDEGNFCTLGNNEEKREEVTTCHLEVQRLQRQVNRLKNKKTPNWSGTWINREEALVRFDDLISEYREYTNDYEKGKFDAYIEAEDIICDLDGHD